MRRVAIGQPFGMSAGEFNAHQLAAEFVAAQQARHGTPQASMAPLTDRTTPWVVNNTNYLIRAFSCVSVNGLATNYTQEQSDFISKTPVKVSLATDAKQPILITQDGMPQKGSATRAVTSGITPAWVDFGTGEDFHNSVVAGPNGSTWVDGKPHSDLKSGYGGVKILYRPPGEGSLLCAVQIDTGPQLVVAKANDWIYAGDSSIDSDKIVESLYTPCKATFSSQLIGIDIPPYSTFGAMLNKQDGRYYIISADTKETQYGIMLSDLSLGQTVYEDNVRLPYFGSNVTAKASTSLLESGDRIPEGTKVIVANKGNGQWEVIAVSCD